MPWQCSGRAKSSKIWKFVAGVPDRSGGEVGDPARNGNLIDSDGAPAIVNGVIQALQAEGADVSTPAFPFAQGFNFPHSERCSNCGAPNPPVSVGDDYYCHRCNDQLNAD